ncbi:hypothetical protein DL98DRAFT_521524 [Cadophora sp. DSE1049]|nr:hypothetical protein DL98DRAFT_521524 [Cadophora sp. DSE1049]
MREFKLTELANEWCNAKGVTGLCSCGGVVACGSFEWPGMICQTRVVDQVRRWLNISIPRWRVTDGLS